MRSKSYSSADELFAHPGLWRGKQLSHDLRTISTGFSCLDNCLPGNGWPQGAVTEIVHGTHGCGELSLLLPALAQLSREKRRITLIDPPWVPYPAALYNHGLALEQLILVHTRSSEESLWACEQVVRGIPGGALLAWPDKLSFSELRRLQLAAKSKQHSIFMFREDSHANASSPAELRLQLSAGDGELEVRVLKCRGQRPTAGVHISRAQLLRQRPDGLAQLDQSSGSASSTGIKPISPLPARRAKRSATNTPKHISLLK